MRKALYLAIDLAVFALAAAGSLMAFGLGASLAVLRSAFMRRNPLEMARPSASKARRALRFIYRHCGLPRLLGAASAKLRALRRW